jgi:chromosome segregation protein
MPSHLLSIEVQGYKTFANRFRFDFPGEITCVVGPNGSGKSNIADAIRWVMGEQSYNLLRARKTEDLIFSGSSNRPRAGMASVTITFNNEDNWFPLDYSEVTITRRAYRDGQNEYFLNNQKVRLKDVSELLSRSGVTPRTYTIIGQGLVDAALSLRPDERRQFFEEAAGISLHRKRREEALTRLDTTHRNLDRVADILSELKPRLSSLEKQASRAIEQERIKTELSTLMKEWYGYHWHRTQDEIQRSQEILRLQEERLEKSKINKEQIDASIKEIQDELYAVRNALGGWHAESSELHKHLEAVNRSMAVSEERLRSINEQTNFMESDLARLDEEAKSIRMRIDQDEKEKLDVLSEKEELTAFLNDAEHKYQELVRQRKAITIEKENAEREYNRLESEKVRVKVQIQEFSDRLESYGPLKNRLQTERAGAETHLQTRQTESDRLEQEVRLIRSALDDQQGKIKGLDKERSALKIELEKLTKSLNVLENEKTKKTSQKDIYLTSIHSNDHLGSNAKTFLQTLKSSFHDISIDSLLNSFSVEKGYEKAIAAGLGEYLDAFLLYKNNDLDRLLNFISEKDIGRVVLFPAWKGSMNQSQENDGVFSKLLGRGADFVHFKSGEISPMIQSLLEDILVVEDRSAALEIRAHVSKHRCVVTVSGDVFRGNSAIISGKDQRDGFFVVQRRIDELSGEIEGLDGEIRTKTSDIKAADQSLNEKIKLQRDLEKEFGARQRNLEITLQKRNKTRLHIEEIQRQMKYLNQQTASIDQQIKDVTEKIDGLQKKLRDLEGNATQAYQFLQEKLRALKALDEGELQLEINHWRTKLAVIQKSAEEVERRLTLDANRSSELLKQKQSLENRKMSVQTEVETIQTSQTGYLERTSALHEALDALSQKIEPAEQAVLSMEGEISKRSEEQNLLQQRLTAAERYVTQAHLDLSRRNDEMEKLREKIEDDFGLVHLEYKREIIGPTPLPLNGMVDELPLVESLSSDLDETIKRQKALLRRIGPINPDATSEFESVKERFDHLTTQMADLEKADKDLREIISELDTLMKKEFQATFKLVAQAFKEMFTRLFGGGSARLILLDEENPTEAGIEIEAQLPGKRKQGLAVLSGGERSLTAVALIFALLKVSPTPFCVLDEVDAALDEANVGRFGELLRELSEQTQFIVITHNRNTVQLADVIYGVTMSRDSTSQVISLKMDEVSDNLVN